MLIIPTIGRKVWFFASSKDVSEMAVISKEQAFDATVLYVHRDNTVNLSITDHKGHTFTREFVELGIPNEFAEHDTDVFGYATWMPYQVNQARKHNA